MDKINETLKEVRSHEYQKLPLLEKQNIQKKLKEYFTELKQEKNESKSKSLITTDEAELRDLELHIKNLTINVNEIRHELDTDNEASDTDSIADEELEKYEDIYLEEHNIEQIKALEFKIIALYNNVLEFKTEIFTANKEEPPLEIQVTQLLEIETILETQIKNIKNIQTLNELEAIEFSVNRLEKTISDVMIHPNKFKEFYFEKMRMEKGQEIPYKKLIIIRETLYEEIYQLQARFETIAVDMLNENKNYQIQITSAYNSIDELQILLERVKTMLFSLELVSIEEKIKIYTLKTEELIKYT